MSEKEEKEEINQKLLYYLVIIGDSQVGKTTLFHRIKSNIFQKNTLLTTGPSERSILNLKLDNEDVELFLVDTPGLEPYKIASEKYLSKSDAALILYDVTKKNSFQNIDNWIEFIKNCIPEKEKETYTYFIAGTKTDLLEDNGYEKKEREVEEYDAKDKCEDKNLVWLGEISSKCGNGKIIQLEEILKTIHEKRKAKKQIEKERRNKKLKQLRKSSSKKPSKKKKKCCDC